MDAGPAALARTFDMAIQNKNDKEETSAGSFGYEHGSTQKHASPKYNARFAGERGEQLIGGLRGEFGSIANNPELFEAQNALKEFAMKWASGPFGLAPAGPGPGAMPPEETA